MIGRIRRLIAVCVGVMCLVLTAGRVRVDLSGALSSGDGSGREGGAPALLRLPPGRG